MLGLNEKSMYKGRKKVPRRWATYILSQHQPLLKLCGPDAPYSLSCIHGISAHSQKHIPAPPMTKRRTSLRQICIAGEKCGSSAGIESEHKRITAQGGIGIAEDRRLE